MSLHNGSRNKIAIDSAKLSDARVRAGLAMSEVAEALGCNKSQISRWERGEQVPSDERILKMITLYESKDFVVGGKRV